MARTKCFRFKEDETGTDYEIKAGNKRHAWRRLVRVYEDAFNEIPRGPKFRASLADVKHDFHYKGRCK